MDKLRKVLLGKREKVAVSGESAVSTGSTLLNLACSDRPDVGFLKGGYYYLVGDSMSGKTWLSLSCFAEACRNRAFDSYRFIFDDVEGGALMDIAHYFGKEVAKRLEPPARSKRGRPIHSTTVESFYFHLWDALSAKKPFIYVLDSQDSLTSQASSKKFLEDKKLSERGKDSGGSYGDGKAKYHSEHLRHILAAIRKRGCILIIIGQTRDNLGFGFETRTRAGGRALRFYAHIEIWSSVKGKIQQRVRGKKRTVGGQCLVEVKKNRVTGKVGRDRSVVLPIYYDYGIDDIGSCVDFLIEEGFWKERKGSVVAKDLSFSGTRDELVRHIEQKGLEGKVQGIAARLWQEIEAECAPKRKRRYE